MVESIALKRAIVRLERRSTTQNCPINESTPPEPHRPAPGAGARPPAAGEDPRSRPTSQRQPERADRPAAGAARQRRLPRPRAGEMRLHRAGRDGAAARARSSTTSAPGRAPTSATRTGARCRRASATRSPAPRWGRFFDRAADALESGTMDARDDTTLNWMPMAVDAGRLGRSRGGLPGGGQPAGGDPRALPAADRPERRGGDPDGRRHGRLRARPARLGRPGGPRGAAMDGSAPTVPIRRRRIGDGSATARRSERLGSGPMPEPVTVSVEVARPRQEVFDYVDVLANHEGWMDHLYKDWRFEGPRRGVGGDRQGAGRRARLGAGAGQLRGDRVDGAGADRRGGRERPRQAADPRHLSLRRARPRAGPGSSSRSSG